MSSIELLAALMAVVFVLMHDPHVLHSLAQKEEFPRANLAFERAASGVVVVRMEHPILRRENGSACKALCFQYAFAFDGSVELAVELLAGQFDVVRNVAEYILRSLEDEGFFWSSL